MLLQAAVTAIVAMLSAFGFTDAVAECTTRFDMREQIAKLFKVIWWERVPVGNYVEIPGVPGCHEPVVWHESIDNFFVKLT